MICSVKIVVIEVVRSVALNTQLLFHEMMKVIVFIHTCMIFTEQYPAFKISKSTIFLRTESFRT